MNPSRRSESDWQGLVNEVENADIDSSRSSALYESYYQHCTIEDDEMNHLMWISIHLAK